MKNNRWQIIFENEDFLVVDKPASYLTIPDRYDSGQANLYHDLLKYRGDIFVNHRLDKDTSGLILFSKNETTHKAFSQLFENRLIDKFYYALVHGVPPLETAQIDLAIEASKSRKIPMVVSEKGKTASTKYRVIESWGRYSWLELQLLTGRMHQIRVHLQAIHSPLICDVYYGDGQPLFLSEFKKHYRRSAGKKERPLLERQALHAHMLKFTSPIDKKVYEFKSEMPKDMRAAINQFDKCLEKD